jgi:DNA modification methylase
MNIVLRKVDELIRYEKNARVHSLAQIHQIAESIKNFGFNDPIEIGKDNILISGHARLEAANKLGMKEVPTITHDHMTKTQRKGYVLAANRIAMSSTWDNELLKLEFEELQDDDFDLTLTGFEQDEIDLLLNPEELNDGLVDADECGEIDEENVVSKLGDVWILGNHRLMCGDSTMVDNVDKVMSGQSPNMMITDPPYGVKLDMSWRDKAKPDGTKNNKNIVLNDDIADWYDTYVLFKGNIAYVWHAPSFTDVVMDGLRRSGFDVKQQIIWNKSALVMGRSNYHWKHEPCWYAVRKGATSNWKSDRKQTTVWDISAPNASSGSKSNDDKTIHPTQKPIEVYTRSIDHHTNPGEYIYDPFGGSGTLVIACEKTGRRALSIELHPKYVDVIVRRWQKFTGKKAIHEETGVEFNG